MMTLRSFEAVHLHEKVVEVLALVVSASEARSTLPPQASRLVGR